MTAQFEGACCCWCSVAFGSSQPVRDTPQGAYCAAMGRLFPDYKFQCKRGSPESGGREDFA
jgi:hypothetical protein